ncbi:FAD-dependent oxidoreductase [Planosporangium thailandense]|uniref:FAD-dependent oxidoreductase n=1 Tax=Planosporangium thailandense TaxID=765197 RepID=A0ABX0XZC8_9ACTN|nr:FAD-binding oxidoreductase [Planosporangium thailandense]NJC71445.1 FAD-dependent oxidoreductase [Planosporangium thailandense]
MTTETYRQLSLWHDAPSLSWEPRPCLPGSTEVDVAIVGAGYTGLWTAYYLAKADPSLRIAVLEAEVAGFGASGRNGGWCSAIFPATLRKVASSSSPEAARRMQHAMNATVTEIGRVVTAEGIDCDFAPGGYVSVARNEAQWSRARREVQGWRDWGFGEDHMRLLSAEEATAQVGATRVLGGTFTPHCAAVHPAKLVRGLADVVEAAGVKIYERTRVERIEKRRLLTAHGEVRAGVVVRATEGYTSLLPRMHRDIVPMYSLMVATEPLPDEVWDQIGLRSRQTFSDKRHLRIYGQRTVDGRLAFGGRGAPYHFGSRVRPEFDRDARVHAMLRAILADLFPVVRDTTFTHAWGGNLGIPRDWYPTVGYDRESGFAYAGGYVGDGVATANLAGRTLADLVTGQPSDLVDLPWLSRRSPKWEPEPLRWLGVNGGTLVFATADRTEAASGKPSRMASYFWKVLGH